jgi:hypothetical protein
MDHFGLDSTRRAQTRTVPLVRKEEEPQPPVIEKEIIIQTVPTPAPVVQHVDQPITTSIQQDDQLIESRMHNNEKLTNSPCGNRFIHGKISTLEASTITST